MLRRPVAAWFAALALLVQIGFGAAPAAASPEQRAAAALGAAIGQQVSLCARGEHSPADQSCPCCGDCALCGLVGCGAPAPLALRVVALLSPERASPHWFHPDDEAAPRPLVLLSSARPRAPPLSA